MTTDDDDSVSRPWLIPLGGFSSTGCPRAYLSRVWHNLRSPRYAEV